MYHDGTESECYGTISFDVFASSGEFGSETSSDGISPEVDSSPVPTSTGDGSSQNSGLGEAPYPGDPGFCGPDTAIIELPEVITTTLENTVTTQLNHPLLDEPGISIANVYTNDSNIATVKDFFPQNLRGTLA